MKYIYTDFYTEFECVGGTCSDTCCAGWGVVIDDATMKKYIQLEEPQRDWICSQIQEESINNTKRNVIKMKEDGRCPFLNGCNLCDIYLQVSPDALSDTCQTYPRKNVNYYDVIMATLSVSCPEAARILLSKKDPVIFGYTENNLKADTSGADWYLYNELINGLVLTTGLLQNRSYAIRERVYLVLELTYQVQKHIEDGQLTDLRKNVEWYNDAAFCEEKLNEMRSAAGKMPSSWNLIYKMFEGIEAARAIPKEQQNFLLKYKILEASEGEIYYQWTERFRNIEIETEFENLAVEFVFEYYMDALEGKNIFFNIIKMVLLLVLVRTCEVVHYNKFEVLTLDNKIEIVSKLSRVMEHTKLLDMFAEELIDKNRKERLHRLAYLLY